MTANKPLFRQPAQSRRMVPLLAAALTATALVGCTVLSSELPATLDLDGRAPEGVHYYLPKFVVDLTLSVDSERASFSVSAGTPNAIADKAHRYYLNYLPLPQYDDKITVALSPKQGFLKTVTANTTDRTSDIIKNLAKAVGAFGGLESAEFRANEVQLTSVTVDPADSGQLARAVELMNTDARRYAKAQRTKACGLHGEDKEAGFILDVKQRARCETYKSLLREHAYVAVAFAPLHGLASRCHAAHFHHEPRGHHGTDHRRHVRAADPIKRADCTSGVCYRPALPYELCMTAGRSVARQVMMVPNASRVVEIDINRAFLVNKTQQISFDDNGMLESMQITKASELLALSALPLEVINALAEGMQLRVNIIDQQMTNSGASKDLIEARAGLEKQRGLLESASRAAGGGMSTSSYSGLPSASRTSLPVTQSSGSVFDRVKPLN